MNEYEKQPNSNANNSNILSKMPSFKKWREKLAKKSEVVSGENERFDAFVDFFKRDSDIKKCLVELSPKEQELYGDGAIEYSDRLYDGIRDISRNMAVIMRNFYQSDTLEQRLEQIKTDVVEAGANQEKLKQVYQNEFIAMAPDFSDSVRKEAIGYYYRKDLSGVEKKTKSINEMLHLIHSSIVNDETILQSLPVLKSNDGEYDNQIKLYGTEASRNPVAEEVFNILKDGNEAYTDIVSLPNRTLMMVRDRGHALTMDIGKDVKSGKYFIDYFVPKICNVDKVNKLPGVRQVKKKEGVDQVRESTTGTFSIEKESDVAKAVVDFINMVPTDDDMPYIQNLKKSAD